MELYKTTHEHELKLGFLFWLLFIGLVFGVNWAAYESHIANEGVQAMAGALSMPEEHGQQPDDHWKWEQPKPRAPLEHGQGEWTL